jgi:hypothetical protein
MAGPSTSRLYLASRPQGSAQVLLVHEAFLLKNIQNIYVVSSLQRIMCLRDAHLKGGSKVMCTSLLNNSSKTTHQILLLLGTFAAALLRK